MSPFSFSKQLLPLLPGLAGILGGGRFYSTKKGGVIFEG